jgi:hypothetical protein
MLESINLPFNAEKAKAAYCVTATGERRFLFGKSVIGPDGER